MRLLAWFPALALALLIWQLSSTPDLAIATGGLDLVLRKAAHVGAFGLLALLCLVGLRANGVGAPRAITASAGLALVYAIVDEAHQATVPTRNGAPHDVAIDALGIGLASATAIVTRRRGLWR